MRLITHFKKELQRAAWRLQYQARSKRKRECAWNDSIQSSQIAVDQIENRLLLEQMLVDLQPMGKKVIYELFINDKSETELAKELQITQQAVNKWKRKTLHSLSQKVIS